MIVGFKSLEKKFDNLSDVNLKKPVGQAISMVQGAAKEKCRSVSGELRSSIYTSVAEVGDGVVRGTCYTNKEYAPYVEFGTGQKGQANHNGISPDVAVAYSQSPWWIHESQIDKEMAERYHFFYIDTPNGRFYQSSGQPAQPFMYPALKDNEDDATDIMAKAIRRQL